MEENWALLTLKKTFGSGLAFISPRLKETCLPALIASFLRRPNFLQTRLLLLAREKSVCPHQRAVAQWHLCRAEMSLTLEITEIWSQRWGHLPLPCASPPPGGGAGRALTWLPRCPPSTSTHWDDFTAQSLSWNPQARDHIPHTHPWDFSFNIVFLAPLCSHR